MRVLLLLAVTLACVVACATASCRTPLQDGEIKYDLSTLAGSFSFTTSKGVKYEISPCESVSCGSTFPRIHTPHKQIQQHVISFPHHPTPPHSPPHTLSIG